MAWIRIVAESDADGDVRSVYDAHQKARGEAILDAVSIMGFFQFANFHADVLGLDVNPEYATMRKVEGMGKA